MNPISLWKECESHIVIGAVRWEMLQTSLKNTVNMFNKWLVKKSFDF